MSEDRDEPDVRHTEEEWTEDDQAQLMARYERIADEAVERGGRDGQSVVADFNLGGAVPRHEGARGPYTTKDIYIRLEHTIYGPVTQDELGEMLASGDLTGFESASADLQHWTPLIYHPRMTLSGEVDPDATHDLLHNRSSLPAASRPSAAVDLEALAEDDAEIPVSTPLAAILIKPVKVSKKTGLPLPIHADLEEESIEHVIERTDITEEQRVSGQQALAEIAQRAAELVEAGELEFGGGYSGDLPETDQLDVVPEGIGPVPDGLEAQEDLGFAPPAEFPDPSMIEPPPPPPAPAAPEAPHRWRSALGLLITLVIVVAVAVGAWMLFLGGDAAGPPAEDREPWPTQTIVSPGAPGAVSPAAIPAGSGGSGMADDTAAAPAPVSPPAAAGSAEGSGGTDVDATALAPVAGSGAGSADGSGETAEGEPSITGEESPVEEAAETRRRRAHRDDRSTSAADDGESEDDEASEDETGQESEPSETSGEGDVAEETGAEDAATEPAADDDGVAPDAETQRSDETEGTGTGEPVGASETEAETEEAVGEPEVEAEEATGDSEVEAEEATGDSEVETEEATGDSDGSAAADAQSEEAAEEMPPADEPESSDGTGSPADELVDDAPAEDVPDDGPSADETSGGSDGGSVEDDGSEVGPASDEGADDAAQESGAGE